MKSAVPDADADAFAVPPVRSVLVLAGLTAAEALVTGLLRAGEFSRNTAAPGCHSIAVAG